MTAFNRVGLGARLVALGLGASLLATGVGGWFLRQSVHETVQRSIELDREQRVERILLHLRVASDGRIVDDRSRVADEFSAIFSGWYWRLDSGGRELRSRSLWDSGLALPGAAADGGVGATRLVRSTGPRGEPLLGIRRPVRLGGQDGLLVVLGPAAESDAELARIDRTIVVTQVALILMLALATLAQVRWGLRPLRRLRNALAAVRNGSVQRIGDIGDAGGFGADLEPLAREMDDVLTRNAQIVARARHHTADLSHALKKPLALLSAEAGANPQVRSELVRSEVAAMARLIDRHLARAGSGAGARRRIDPREHVDALVALMRRLHRERDLDWQVTAPAKLTWSGEPTDLDEMLGNLLDNAGKWAARSVHITASVTNAELRVQVDDDGAGLDEAQIGEATRRGRRFDEATEGNGLGLAIVCDIAETYGGRLELARSTLGGLHADLHLPA